ncbi:MAG: PQQ-binding-like beta-propeller repeat protein [Candidatus Zixiibacteriota bacterium]
MLRCAIRVTLVVTIAIVGCARPYRMNGDELSEATQWPFHRGDRAATGALSDGSFSGKLDVLWEKRIGDKPAGPLTLNNDRLIFPGTKRKIKFFDASNGRQLGKWKVKADCQTGVAISDSLAVYSTSPPRNRLRCQNLLSGKTIWSALLKDAASGSILLTDRLIIGSADGELLAFGLSSGETLWKHDADAHLVAPVSYADGVIYQPADNGAVIAVSADSGQELFVARAMAPLVSAAAVSSGRIYCVDVKGMVYSFSSLDGQELWRKQLSGPGWAAPAVSNGRLFVVHRGGELLALDTATGSVLWRFATVEVVRAAATVAGRFVLVATMGGKVFSLDAATGTLIERRQLQGGIARSPVTDGNRVYVATDGGMIVCYGEHDENYSQAD